VVCRYDLLTLLFEYLDFICRNVGAYVIINH
jgi:hypothetical protein